MTQAIGKYTHNTRTHTCIRFFYLAIKITILFITSSHSPSLDALGLDSTPKNILQVDMTNGLPVAVVQQADRVVRYGHFDGLCFSFVLNSTGSHHTLDGVCYDSDVYGGGMKRKIERRKGIMVRGRS